MRGGSHFHARRVLAVASIPSLDATHCEVLQGQEAGKTITYVVLYIFIFFFTCLFISMEYDEIPKRRGKHPHTNKGQNVNQGAKFCTSIDLSFLHSSRRVGISLKRLYIFLISNKSHDETEAKTKRILCVAEAWSVLFLQSSIFVKKKNY